MSAKLLGCLKDLSLGHVPVKPAARGLARVDGGKEVWQEVVDKIEVLKTVPELFTSSSGSSTSSSSDGSEGTDSESSVDGVCMCMCRELLVGRSRLRQTLARVRGVLIWICRGFCVG
jgi:hypothetical protein